jgi:hypothetical protein
LVAAGKLDYKKKSRPYRCMQKKCRTAVTYLEIGPNKGIITDVKRVH